MMNKKFLQDGFRNPFLDHTNEQCGRGLAPDGSVSATNSCLTLCIRRQAHNMGSV
ncbi:hypothetical protein C4J89_1956 [Pseudomonas sp. R4-35-07]|nr:hypothetical protein C4J89_1956 [Pseudomonas sp. R4-35-07]